MRRVKLIASACALGAFVCAFSPSGWSSKLGGDTVSGTVTATPVSGQIEVEQRVYPIKAHSAAERNFRAFGIGANVDLTLDGPAGSSSAAVINIAPHSQT